MKFTFKKEPRETGLAGVGNPNPPTNIKLGGKLVGVIHGPNWASKDNLWSVRLMVVDPEGENCRWKWITLKQRFATEPEARAFIKENANAIRKLNLWNEEEES